MQWTTESTLGEAASNRGAEVHEVAAKFIQANCYQPTVPGIRFCKC
ncbi:hypothetical protein [Nostoc sp. MG11]|nr:hypothetical protein [Nostoc sp. MG11]